MTGLEQLNLEHNEFIGSLPRSLMSTNLWSFSFYDTHLCEPQDSDFQMWLLDIGAIGTFVACNTPAFADTDTYSPPHTRTVFVPLAFRPERGSGRL